MDIRRFLKKRKSNQDAPHSFEAQVESADQRRREHDEQILSATIQLPPAQTSLGRVAHDLPHHLDIGSYVKTTECLTNDKKYDLLENAYVPSAGYKFKNDSHGSHCFCHAWINQYSPWLAYSSYLKGAFCKFCVLFPQPVHRGTMGSFILTPFVKYKDFHENARKRMISTWHKGVAHDAHTFLTIALRLELNIVSQIDQSVNETVIRNQEKLLPILSTILFCGSHDIALRGKKRTFGNLYDLLCFRIEAGDAVLKDHFEGETKMRVTCKFVRRMSLLLFWKKW